MRGANSTARRVRLLDQIQFECSTGISQRGNEMKIWTACLALVIGFTASASHANGEHTPPLYELATRYEATVKVFEQVVLKTRGIDRADERLVDRLDDATKKLRLGARNPRQLNRVFYEWRDVQKLHAQVEATIFGKYTPHHDLVRSWDEVRYSYSLFAEEFFYHIENPRHGNSVRRAQSSSARRDSYLALPQR